MPVPNKKENKSDFISRCIPIVINEGTTKDNKQAAAICFSIWKKHRPRSTGGILEDIVDERVINKLDDKE